MFATVLLQKYVIAVEIFHQANSLEVLSVELRGGRAKCPYHPDSNYTIILVGKHIRYFCISKHSSTSNNTKLVTYTGR